LKSYLLLSDVTDFRLSRSISTISYRQHPHNRNPNGLFKQPVTHFFVGNKTHANEEHYHSFVAAPLLAAATHKS
jgi:hypothetical protein